MSDAVDHLAQRVREAQAARAAVRDRSARTVERLGPTRLLDDAVDLLGETAEQIRAHPWTALGAALVIVGLTFHQPLGRLVQQLLDTGSPPEDDALDQHSDQASLSSDAGNAPLSTETQT